MDYFPIFNSLEERTNWIVMICYPSFSLECSRWSQKLINIPTHRILCRKKAHIKLMGISVFRRDYGLLQIHVSTYWGTKNPEQNRLFLPHWTIQDGFMASWAYCFNCQLYYISPKLIIAGRVLEPVVEKKESDDINKMRSKSESSFCCWLTYCQHVR